METIRKAVVWTVIAVMGHTGIGHASGIELSWSPNPEPDIKFYGIYRAATLSDETEIAQVSASETAYLDQDITVGQVYLYRIVAVDSADNVSEFSEQIIVPTDGNAASGDVNNDGNLTPGDALCAFEIYLNGQAVPTDCDTQGFLHEMMAANVNCDDSVTPADALAIFDRYLTQQPPEPCFAGGSTSLAKSPGQNNDYQLSLRQATSPRTANRPGDELLELAVLIDNPYDLDAFGVTVSYPEDKLTFIAVERSSVTADWQHLAGRVHTTGEVTIGGFTTQPVASVDNGELLQLVFRTLGAATGVSDFSMHDFVDDFSLATAQSSLSGAQDLTALPEQFTLYQNYPNPFNPETRIRFDLPVSVTGEKQVRLVIYNVNGQIVRGLLHEGRSAGSYELTWDGRNAAGAQVPSGVYFYAISAGAFQDTRKMILMK